MQNFQICSYNLTCHCAKAKGTVKMRMRPTAWLCKMASKLSTQVRKSNYLSLEKKVQVIKHLQENPGTSIRALGEKFGCGKTQIAYILNNKESILSLFFDNSSGSRVHTIKSRTSEYSEVNVALHKWFRLACSNNVYPGGAELMEKAKEIYS